MVKISSILGLNARSQLVSYKHNTSNGKKIARSKLLTKKYLKKANILTPTTYAKFKNAKKIVSFNWNKLPNSFALKPNKGLGGQGIIVVKKRVHDGWVTTKKENILVEDIKLHTQDILEGAYSLANTPDIAYIEEYIGRHKAFKKYAYRGTPDIRVIVFNKVPLMAMLRLPTKESGGRANLHQGAIAVGIDIATGITTFAYYKKKYIKYKPGTQRKLNGLKIPDWTQILKIAVECSIATRLGFLGVDIVLHPEKGPMVLEINYQPGLSIQVANKGGLRKRIERVDDLEVNDSAHGVRIAKAIFASRFSDRVAAREGIRTVNIWEKVDLVSMDKKRIEIRAKVDTGAWRSSIDRTFAGDLGLLKEENVLWSKIFKSGIGRQERKVINISFFLAGRKIKTIASVADRSKLRTPLIIGRRDLKGFLVSPTRILTSTPDSITSKK